MRAAIWGLLLSACLASVSFKGFPNDGVITVSCQASVTFPIGYSFEQNCVANNCVAPVRYSFLPNLEAYGVFLSLVNPVKLVITPSSLAVAHGTLSATVFANDQDGPGANGTITINYLACPLKLTLSIPNQTAIEGQMFTLNVATFFNAPSRGVSWVLEGLPSRSVISINPQGLIQGIPSYVEAGMREPLKLIVIATDSATQRTVRSNVFDLTVLEKPGISFPSSLGLIPTQTGTEGVLFQLPVAPYFNNPSNFSVVWSIAAGGLLRIDLATGVVTGTLGNGQSTSVTVTGTDERGHVARSNTFTFDVKPLAMTAKPIPPLPPIVCGSKCCSFNLTDFVVNPSSNAAVFTSGGIPAGSQISVSADGTLSGMTSMVDMQASPIVLTVTASNGGTTLSLPRVTFQVTPLAGPTVSAQSFPPRSVKVDSSLLIDTTPYFVIPDSGFPITWALSSASPSLVIDQAGKVSGIVTQRDYSQSPLAFTVTVSNKNPCGGGSISRVFTVAIEPNWKGPSCKGVANFQGNMILCEQTKMQFDFTRFCSDPNGFPLTYSITGLPANSGLTFDPNSGLLSGIPTKAASDLGSVAVVVCATSKAGFSDCLPQFLLTFQHPLRKPIVDPPIPSPISALKGQRFVGYLHYHFYEPDGQPLVYSISGLPIGSGLSLGPMTGVFSGTPNEADYRASPLVLSVFASNEQGVLPGNTCQFSNQGGRARAELILVVEDLTTPPICNPIPSQGTAQVGQYWFAGLSRYFLPGDGPSKLEFSLRLLPRGSGLAIDSKSGVVAGVLTSQDAIASPLNLVVNVSNGRSSCESSFSLVVVDRVTPPQPDPRSCPILIQDISLQTCLEGSTFTLNLNQFIKPANNVRVAFSSSGLPLGTGFVQSSSGVFSGTPSQADLGQGVISVLTTFSCGPFWTPVTKQWQLKVSRGNGCSACVNNGGCQQICNVVNPQFCVATCGCTRGFVINGDGKSCRPMGGCDQDNGGCQGICSMQGMVPMCSCAQNWLLQSDKRSCRYDPCGSNNGGCQQLCTSDGVNPRCDCRVGSLNSDGRTCSNDIIVVGTIPPALVLGCQQFIFDLSTAFSHVGPGQLSFLVLGFPPDTGFMSTTSGMLSGTPSSADCALAQPMAIGITARLANTSVHATMFISAFCGIPNQCGLGSTPIARPGQAQPIPVMNASVCIPFQFDMRPYFVGGKGSIQFSVLGLPQGSGFEMATQGLLSGTPTDLDCAVSPLSVTVLALDSIGRTSKAIVTIRFTSCGCAQPTMPASLNAQYNVQPPPSFVIPAAPIPSSSAILPQAAAPAAAPLTPPLSQATPSRISKTAQCGQPFFLDVSDIVYAYGVRFTLQGLPPNTALRLSDTGILSGIPNSADAQASPLHVYVTAVDRFGGSRLLQIELQILGDCGELIPSAAEPQLSFRSASLVSSLAPQDSNTGILPIQFAQRGTWFRLNLSRISFSGLDGNLTYEADGLPPKSGLSLTKDGILAGLPSETDCSITKPIRVNLRVTALNESIVKYMFIQMVCDAKSRSSATMTGTLPTASAVVGGLLYYDTAPYLTIPSTNLSTVNFTVQGLAKGSQLRISDRGIISGIPSTADMNGPALLVSARTADGTVVQSTLRLQIQGKQLSNNTAPRFVPPEILKAPLGIYFGLNVGQRFYDDDSDALQFSMALPSESGLKFDNQTGILSGIPNKFDLQQPQPARLRAFANDGKGGLTEGIVFVLFLSPTAYDSSTTIPRVPTSVNRSPVSIGIRRQVCTEGVPFLMSVASAFVDQDGDLLSYELSGLPLGTGLTIDASGLISGTPTSADALALQPLRLTISVSDKQGGGCKQDFLLTVFHGEVANHAPLAQAHIPDALGYVDEFLILRMSFYFADVDGDALEYSMTGMPLQSGLAIDANSGVIFGTPTKADLASSPINLALIVDDGAGGSVQSSVRLIVGAARGDQTNISVVSVMTRLNITDGTTVNVSVADYFLSNSKLQFSAYGLPLQTGLVFANDTGVLSGIPTVSDFAAKQPLVVGITACSDRQCVGSLLFISLESARFPISGNTTALSPDSVSVGVSATADAFEAKFRVGNWGFFQTSRYLVSSGSVTYKITGLPTGSGLSFDSLSGVVYGVPNLTDLLTADSRIGRAMLIGVTTSNGAVQNFALKFLLLGTDDTNHAPFGRSIPPAVVEPGSMFLLDVWSSFVDPDGDLLTFSVIGLPDNSGFSIIPSSGVFFGIPSQSDVSMAQPFMLTIVANDQRGGRAQQTLSLSFSRAANASASCRQLGWPIVTNSSFCSRAIKVAGVCPSSMTFLEAQSACAKIGARLCTSQELTVDVLDSEGCPVDRVWSSSACAGSSEFITQASVKGMNVTKKCSHKTNAAMLKCCSSNNPDIKLADVSPNTCSELPAFVTSPTTLNKAVCSAAAIGPNSTCSGNLTFVKAIQFCEQVGARLCTADELSQDIGNDQVCGYASNRVWTASECPAGYFSQAGAFPSLSSVPRNCTDVMALLPVVCCADQRRGEHFQKLQVMSTRDALQLRWNWKAFPAAQLAYQKANTTGWVPWPQGGKLIGMGGDVFCAVQGLEPSTQYVFRITPFDTNNRVVWQSQVVQFQASTMV